MLTAGAHGTAIEPGRDRQVHFTGDFNPHGADFTGADAVTFSASDDGGATSTPLVVQITIAPAPLLGTIFDAPSLQQDAPLQRWDADLRRVLPGRDDPHQHAHRRAGGTARGLHRPAPRRAGGAEALVRTNAAGTTKLAFRPIKTDLVFLDVPALPGVLATGAVLFVAPDWSLNRRLPIRHKKFVITGRLVAEKFARARGTLSFQRRQGSRWVNVTRKVKLSASLKFTVTLSTKYSGKRARFVYTPKSIDYITSTFTFTPKKKKRLAGRVAASGVRAMHR